MQVWPGSGGGLWDEYKPQTDGQAGPVCLPGALAVIYSAPGKKEG